MELYLTDDISENFSPLRIADADKYQSLMKFGKEIIIEYIEWNYDWPKGVLKPEIMEELNRARSIFLEALSVDRVSYRAKFYMGMISAEMNDLKDACRWFEEASEILPYDSDCQRYIGIISGLLGDKTKSIRYLERAVRCHPLGATCWQNLALAYRKVGRLPDARNSIEHALKLDGKCPFNRRALVVIQEDECRTEKSE
jgi:tetratricopeptide (TPR) repeat protein